MGAFSLGTFSPKDYVAVIVGCFAAVGLDQLDQFQNILTC